jgi:biotin carboxyl carrier protein
MSGRPERRSGPTRARSGTTTYIVDVAGETLTIELGPDGVRVGEVSVEAAIYDIPGSPIRLLRIGDAVFEVVAERGERRGQFTLTVGGVRLVVDALDERTRAARSVMAAAAAQHGPEPVRAPMPGLVTRVLVSPGDAVSAGSSLVVMEAMKMENELRAKVAGRVRAVHVAAGTAVEKGAVLIELE